MNVVTHCSHSSSSARIILVWHNTSALHFWFSSVQCLGQILRDLDQAYNFDSTEWACNVWGVRRLTFLRRQPSPSAPLPGEVGYCPAMKECIIVKCTSISKAKRKGLNYAQDDTTGKAGSLSLCWTQSRESKFSLWVGQQALIGINGWNKFKTHTHIHTLNAPNTHSHKHSYTSIFSPVSSGGTLGWKDLAWANVMIYELESNLTTQACPQSSQVRTCLCKSVCGSVCWVYVCGFVS